MTVAPPGQASALPGQPGARLWRRLCRLPGKLFARLSETSATQFTDRTITVISEEQVDSLLSKLGVRELVRAGRLRCRICRARLNDDSLSAIMFRDGVIVATCSMAECERRIRE